MTGEAVEGGVVKGGGENPSGSPDSIAGIFFTGHGNGYRLTVPAKSTDKILKLYLGLWHGRGRFEAKQSDGLSLIHI